MTYPGPEHPGAPQYGGQNPYGAQQPHGGQDPYGAYGGQFPQQPYPGQQPYPQQPHPGQQPYPGQPYLQQPYPGPQGQFAGQQQPPGGFPPQTPPGGQPQFTGAPKQPRRQLGRIIGVMIAVLVIAVGGGATFWVVNMNTATGADTPVKAVQNLAEALEQDDLPAAMRMLPPGEANAAMDVADGLVEELKRLNVFRADFDLESSSGVGITTKNLRFDEQATERVNDRVAITKLVGGTITIEGDSRKLPFSEKFIELVFGGEVPSATNTETIDIGDIVDSTGEPVRIATVNADGRWHASLLHTIADQILAEENTEWPEQTIPARGADSPEQVVQRLGTALGEKNLRKVVELLPPDEMAVLHNLGPLVPESNPEGPDIRIDKIETETEEATGGTQVTITGFTGEVDGATMSVRKSGDCYELTRAGRSERMCGSDIASELDDPSIPPEVRDVLQGVFGKILQEGPSVITTEVDGKHYLSPLRTFGNSLITILRSFDAREFERLLEAAN